MTSAAGHGAGDRLGTRASDAGRRFRKRSEPLLERGARVVASPWLLVGIVAGGIALRIEGWVQDRSLWGDEGALALNLIGKSAAGLTHQLNYVQGAPTGFLLAEHLDVRLFGQTELSLRLFPLVSGIVALILFAVIARRVTTPGGAAVAVLLFATSDLLVYYSSEVKQYSTDVLVATLLLFGSVTTDWHALRFRRGVVLALAAIVAVWFSHPGLLVLPSLLAVLLLAALLRGDQAALRNVILVASPIVASAFVFYLLNRSTAHSVGQAALGDSAPGRLTPFKDVWHSFSTVLGTADTTTALVVLAALAGGLRLIKRDPVLLGLLTAPVAATFVAAVLGLYPFSDRFILFLAPFYALLVAEGIVEISRLVWHGLPIAAIACVVLLLIYPLGVAAQRAVKPPGHEEVKAVLRVMDAKWQPGDALYVWYQSQFPFRYYAECRACGVLGDRGPRTVVWPRSLDRTPKNYALVTHPPSLYLGTDVHDLNSYLKNFAPLDGKRRAWFLFSSTWDDQFAHLALDCMGKQLAEVRAKRAVAYLYDLAAPPDRQDCSLPGLTSG
jgi:Dolichyl-phosphate-mannose-protein mannosyltransferase